MKNKLREELIQNGLKDSNVIDIINSQLKEYKKVKTIYSIGGGLDCYQTEYAYFYLIKYKINGIEKEIYKDLGVNISKKWFYSLDMINDLNKEIEYEEYKIKFPNKEIKTKKSKI